MFPLQQYVASGAGEVGSHPLEQSETRLMAQFCFLKWWGWMELVVVTRQTSLTFLDYSISSRGTIHQTWQNRDHKRGWFKKNSGTLQNSIYCLHFDVWYNLLSNSHTAQPSCEIKQPIRRSHWGHELGSSCPQEEWRHSIWEEGGLSVFVLHCSEL